MQWYGGAVAEFQTVGNSFLSLSSIVRGSSLEFIEAMMLVSPGFTIVFTTSFSVIVALFIYALMLATLTNAYTSVRRKIFHYSPSNTRDHEMVGFLMKQLKKWLGITKSKPVICHHPFLSSSSLSAGFWHLLSRALLSSAVLFKTS